MTTLITGGTGKTGLALAKLLHKSNYSVLIASRSGEAPEPFKAVKFDWFDAATFEQPFAINGGTEVDRVYIVAPPGRIDGITPMKDFINLAVSKGVKRFVLVSATQIGPDESIIPTGVIHRYLVDIGVDYTVLRPTWFIDNFGARFLTSIREHDLVFSAAQDGKIPFVSTEDIAQAAFEVLTAKKSPNKDIFVLGPELHSYDDVAKILSSVLGRTITHKRHTVQQQADLYEKFGLNADYANFLAGMDTKISNGDEAALFNGKISEDHKFIGKHTLIEYVQANKDMWLK